MYTRKMIPAIPTTPDSRERPRVRPLMSSPTVDLLHQTNGYPPAPVTKRRPGTADIITVVFEAELAFANEMADRAREISLPLFHRRPEVRLKADRSPVTDADLAIEDLVRKEA